MTDYDFHLISSIRASMPSCRITQKRKDIIESDLRKLSDYVFGMVSGVSLQFTDKDVYKDVHQLRHDVLTNKVFSAPFMEHFAIDSFTYSRYRAAHDIIHHVLCALDFDWQGEATSYELAVRLLRLCGASDVTIGFVRDDVLYRNAMYHAYKGKVPSSEVKKICLKPIANCGIPEVCSIEGRTRKG